jgi:hypothetical protein
MQILAPVGAWRATLRTAAVVERNGGTAAQISTALSTSSSALESFDKVNMGLDNGSVNFSAATAGEHSELVEFTSASTVYALCKSSTTGSVVSISYDNLNPGGSTGGQGGGYISLIPDYL